MKIESLTLYRGFVAGGYLLAGTAAAGRVLQVSDDDGAIWVDIGMADNHGRITMPSFFAVGTSYLVRATDGEVLGEIEVPDTSLT